MSSWRWIPLVVLLGCTGKAREPESEASPAVAKAATPGKPRFVAAGESGDVAQQVQQAVDAAGDPKKVVVYVGASWCGPCQAFHEALERGELDERLPGVEFLEFDADRDTERLEAAGYGGRFIPRFALPGPKGRFGGEKVEGGIKGEGAVEHILARLLPLLAAAA